MSDQVFSVRLRVVRAAVDRRLGDQPGGEYDGVFSSLEEVGQAVAEALVTIGEHIARHDEWVKERDS